MLPLSALISVIWEPGGMKSDCILCQCPSENEVLQNYRGKHI